MTDSSETFAVILKFGILMTGILLVIWLLAAATPYLAKLADKLLGNAKPEQGQSSVPKVPPPERVRENESSGAPEEFKVYDIYEGSPSENEKE